MSSLLELASRSQRPLRIFDVNTACRALPSRPEHPPIPKSRKSLPDPHDPSISQAHKLFHANAAANSTSLSPAVSQISR